MALSHVLSGFMIYAKGIQMSIKIKLIIFLAVSLLLLCGGFYLSADDDKTRHRERKRERHRGDDHYESSLKQVDNPTYKEACGACHFVYQPELLPSGSWLKILDNLQDHFGETVELDDDSKRGISDYLKSNGAENSSAKRAVKIVRSLGNQSPLRITDIPYIREKHSKISSDVLKRKSIGSLSNCPACHKTAESGIYDDNVIIPQ
jgi:hypothetical protein